jgi:hypothetical protein
MAGTVAVSWVDETKEVASGEPLKSMIEPATKFVPLTVSVKLDPPAAVDVGEMVAMVGTGLLIVNV